MGLFPNHGKSLSPTGPQHPETLHVTACLKWASIAKDSRHHGHLFLANPWTTNTGCLVPSGQVAVGFHICIIKVAQGREGVNDAIWWSFTVTTLMLCMKLYVTMMVYMCSQSRE